MRHEPSGGVIASARLRIAVAIGVMVTAAPGRADDTNRADEPRSVNVPMIVLEELGVFLPPTIWYWRTKEHQAVDFDLGWDWKSWKAKLLTFEKVKFDTNPFYINAIRHPLKGALDYQIARTNGMGMLGSTVFASLMGAAWEYIIEYREAPSINDMLLNLNGGIAIGEPLWQFGQLWRGGRPSLGDRVRTALLSPFDALHDGIRGPHRWWRPRLWRSLVFDAGLSSRHFDEGSRGELSLGADLELVAHPDYATSGAHHDALRHGAWSRLKARVWFADASTDHQIVATVVHSRTSISARYRQDDAGNSTLVALATAFTYRKERLSGEWDKLAIAHLLGMHLQLARRTPSYAVRCEVGMYADFALVQAHVFGPVPPFPRPPPYHSALQANGYYDGGGLSVLTRLRADAGAWSLDAELASHASWQINGKDRDPVAQRTESTIPITPQNAFDGRVFWHAGLLYRAGAQWGITAFAEGGYRRGMWHELDRRSSDVAAGLALQLDL
ncbi:MAG: hypothetical protein H6Q90_4901 [Deltaproteobacteria bacterium]|nr:hypothetical protein [Deltaproteobacteria bacterium]